MTVSEKAPGVPCDTGMGPSASLSAAPGSDGGDIDARMKAAGMIPLSDLISGNTPLERWAAHTGVSDLDTFEEWLTRKQREFGVMKAGYELGDKDKGDELYEWVLSHFAAFNEVAANLRQMKERMALVAGRPDITARLRAWNIWWRPFSDAEVKDGLDGRSIAYNAFRAGWDQKRLASQVAANWRAYLIDGLERCAQNPKWPDHAEVSKSLLLMAVKAITENTKYGPPEVPGQVEVALRNYRLSNMRHDDGGGYPLVELMSNDGQSIATGEAEIALLADAIADAIAKPASSTACNVVQPPESDIGSPDAPLPEAGDARTWKTLAIGMGAHLEQLEAHCSVQTGKTGSAHADEGRELREAGKAFVGMVRSLIACRSERGDGLHPETEKLVAEFSFALRAKLLKAQHKYEFGDNWRTDDWETACRQALFKHLIKGDPLDVGAYAAFCWKRGWTTSPPESNYGPSYKVLEDQLAIATKSLQRIRDADHRNTNSSTAAEAFAYAHAVTSEALDAIAAVTETRS